VIILERPQNRNVNTYALTQTVNEMGEGGEDRLELLKNTQVLLQMIGGFSQGIFALLTPETASRVSEEELREMFTLYRDLTLEFVGLNLSFQAEILARAEKHVTGSLAV